MHKPNKLDNKVDLVDKLELEGGAGTDKGKIQEPGQAGAGSVVERDPNHQ